MAVAPKPFVKTAKLQQSQAIVDKDGRPAAWFVRLINDNNANVAEAINRIASLPEIQDALIELNSATAAALSAAAAAQTAADEAGAIAEASAYESALQTSTIDPISVLTADPTTITVAAHNRLYGDGTVVAVAGDTLATLGAAGDADYVYYDDPTRAGGAVTYVVTATQPIQTGDRHVVGAVIVPSVGTVDGGAGPRAPGYVDGNPIP